MSVLEKRKHRRIVGKDLNFITQNNFQCQQNIVNTTASTGNTPACKSPRKGTIKSQQDSTIFQNMTFNFTDSSLSTTFVESTSLKGVFKKSKHKKVKVFKYIDAESMTENEYLLHQDQVFENFNILGIQVDYCIWALPEYNISTGKVSYMKWIHTLFAGTEWNCSCEYFYRYHNVQCQNYSCWHITYLMQSFDGDTLKQNVEKSMEAEEHGEQEWLVKSINQCKNTKGTISFQVFWEGFDEYTWEPIENLNDNAVFIKYLNNNPNIKQTLTDMNLLNGTVKKPSLFKTFMNITSKSSQEEVLSQLPVRQTRAKNSDLSNYNDDINGEIMDDKNTFSSKQFDNVTLVCKKPKPIFSVKYGYGVQYQRCFVIFAQGKVGVLKCKSSHPNSVIHKHHVKEVWDWLKSHPHELNLEYLKEIQRKAVEKSKIHTNVVSISSNTIPFDLTKEQQMHMQNWKYIIHTYQSNYTYLELKCDIIKAGQRCKCENSCIYRQNCEVVNTSAIIWGNGCLFTNVHIYSLHCLQQNKQCEIHYEGGNEYIFNHDNNNLFAYELFRLFLVQCIHLKETFQGFVTSYNTLMQTTLGYTSTLQVSKFQDAFMNWCTLLDHSHLPLHCNLCGKFPDIICFDGTSIGPPRKYSNPKSVKPFGANVSNNSNIKQTERRYFSNKEYRDCLSLLVHDNLNNEQYVAFLQVLHRNHPDFESILSFHGSNISTFKQNITKAWKELFKVLSCFSSATFLLPAVTWNTFTELLLQKSFLDLSIEHQVILIQRSPILNMLIQTFTDKKIPNYCLSFFQNLFNIIKKPFTDSINEPTIHASLSLQELHIDNACNSGIFWFNWEPIREVKMYPDYEKENLQMNVNDQDGGFAAEIQDLDDVQCYKIGTDYHKNKHNHDTLFACCKHGIALGGHIMKTPEGRKDPFFALYTYFPEDTLKKTTIIYDFACQLSEYCLNREPLLFQNSTFLIDRFHRCNHKCCNIFNMNKFPNMTSVNSSAMEQLNSFLDKFSTPISFMKQSTAVRFIIIMLKVYNYYRIKKESHFLDPKHSNSFINNNNNVNNDTNHNNIQSNATVDLFNISNDDIIIIADTNDDDNVLIDFEDDADEDQLYL